MSRPIISFKNTNKWLMIPVSLLTLFGTLLGLYARTTRNYMYEIIGVLYFFIFILVVLGIKELKKIKIYEDHIRTNFHKIKKEDLIKYEWPQNNKIESELHLFANIKFLGVFKVKRKIRIYLSKDLKEEVDMALSQLFGSNSVEILQE